jgi:hypothetical protein
MKQNLVKPGPKEPHSANWRPGQSGNPSGRPVGVRNQFTMQFVSDLRDVWAELGRATMVHCAQKNTDAFFMTCARIVPKDVAISIEQQFPGGLTPHDIAILRAIREAIPDAGTRSPADVLSFTLDAIRSASATIIEPPTDAQTDDQGEI